MEQLIEWTVSNIGNILAAVGALILAAVAIAKITPTKTDDKIIGKVSSIWNKIQKFANKLPPKTK